MKKYIIVAVIILAGISLWAYSTHTQPTVLFGGAGSAGPNSPGTMADDSAVGTVAWSNPDNAKVSDGVYASRTVNFTISHYLKATNFGFSIPAGATINGILVEVERKLLSSSGGKGVQDSKARIVKSDGSIGTTDKAIVGNWSTTETYVSYGSSSDLWGETWAYTDINDTNFGFALSVTGQADIGSAEADVDHIRITVYYTTASGVHASVTNTSGAMNIQGNVIIK